MRNKKIINCFWCLLFSWLFFSLCLAAENTENRPLEYPFPGGPTEVGGKEGFKQYIESFLNFILTVAGLILLSILV